MKHLITVLTAGTTLLSLVSAQGFVQNCTWRSANLTDQFLGMYCNDDNWAQFGYKWTWHDLNFCMINNGGDLVPYDSGKFSDTCRDCKIKGSDEDFILNCNCFDTQNNLMPSSYDINRILWNHDGHLGCYDHAGNTSECGPQCDPGWTPPPPPPQAV
ncbi:hypothetical protein BJ170DRAFT_601556 [Xylariales sp. AK1849]|nr:hypothetical protein BJ170DRAFT_601556 [Xylariales sp. AK1849]